MLTAAPTPPHTSVALSRPASDVYLEELADTAPEADCVTQTDPFLDRPPTPAFVPQKSGVDSATQIEQGGSSCRRCPRMRARIREAEVFELFLPFE